MTSKVSNVDFKNALLKTSSPSYQRLIFAVLRRLHQSPVQSNWDDLVQEARIILAQKLITQKLKTHQTKEELFPYLYQCVYWRVLDILRSRQRRLVRQMSIDDNASQPHIDYHAQISFSHCEHDRLLNQLRPILTKQQEAYLCLLFAGYSDTEIALRWHCSRQAVSNIRKRIIEKGRRFFRNGC